jgi:hypothetical protein
MGESMESLYRRGAISGKQMERMGKPAVLKKTKSGVPTKMAAFDGRKKDEGGVRDRGEVPKNEINHPTNQRAGSPRTAAGLPSRGGQARGGTEPKVGQIDQGAQQRPKFPAGAKVSAAHGKRQVGVVGPKGKSSGPQYGGPSSRANG